ncbi:Sn1-specific diacylglycerol lipase beta [Tolypocladium capitatum]|uniref:sn-1-specific diacylglycerol lipase n=1 Tax=Tolypocladium capitatum TaxID=45235 RepID=A0A2K3QCK0_9HYPO|nr:Sn1-specific diacylglycerol lipase beta [Tolypocladium capitatum]
MPPGKHCDVMDEAARAMTSQAMTSHRPGPTLLPAPVAHAVSLATRSTSLAIRVGSLVGTYSLDAARFTTLSSLELARGLVEGVLSRAARDTLAQSDSALAAAAAETLLERSLEGLHYAVAHVVFWTAASFRLTGTTLAAASEASQLVLLSLDQLFGSTDSSRAVASIVTLVRREFNNPATGACGEKVGVVDLVLALGALAYLQQACRRSAAEEQRRQAYEEVIWDVVVLNDGERVDVHDADEHDARLSHPGAVGPGHDRHGADDDEAVLSRMRSQIISSLSPGTTVSISNSVSSVQTITVDVEGPDMPSLATPPGAEVVETRGPSSTSTNRRSWTPRGQDEELSYRVVYRIERDKFRSMSLRGEDEASGRPAVGLADDEPSSPRQIEESSAPYGGPPAFSDASPALLSKLVPGDSSRPLSSPPSSPGTSTIAMSGAAGADGRSKPRRSSRPTHASPTEPTAKQRRQRSPLTGTRSRGNVRPASDTGKRPLPKKKGESILPSKPTDKRSGLKQVLKGGGQSLSNIWNKESASSEANRTAGKPKPQWKTPSTGNPPDAAAGKPKPSLPWDRSQDQQTQHSLAAARRSLQAPEPIPRSSSRASYVSIRERRHDSVVSQTDAYSIHSNGEMRPASPTIVRSDYSTQESTVRPRSDVYSAASTPPSPRKGQRRSPSHAPSLYSLATNDSQSSLILSSYYQKSAYNASGSLSTLRREGFVDGTFPAGHLLPNIARYMRFSSACYGSHFLKFMGISTEPPALGVWDGTHHDVRHFVHHTESEAGNILLASFVDPQGGADASGSTGTGVPLVHYISLDHEAKAVVLACRGTLGFEDVMADMACEYDDMMWRGRRYKVHKGIHASARRLLYGDDGRVLVTIKEALREFPDYGLVLCGHSLGGAVTSLLGVMLAQPNPGGPGFVISAEPHIRLLRPADTDAGADATDTNPGDLRLPSGRRIHVYAYGPPGVMSPSLRKITRGLITSVVHGNDLVPHLSLGLLHDMQALALAFKTDNGSRTGAEIRTRMWLALQAGLADRWHHHQRRAAPRQADEQWVLPALGALRGSMRSARLVPPGEVFAIESTPVLRRDAFVVLDDGPVGRPAQRVVLKYVRDVEARFGEVRFGTGMLTDHSPAKYEDALNKLRLGVVE